MIDYTAARHNKQWWGAALVGITILLFLGLVGSCLAYVIQIPAPGPFVGTIEMEVLPPETLEDKVRGCPGYFAIVKVEQLETALLNADALDRPGETVITRIKIVEDYSNPLKCQAV